MNSNHSYSAMSISAITTAPIFPPSPPPSVSPGSHQQYYHHRTKQDSTFHYTHQQEDLPQHPQLHQGQETESEQQQLGSPPTSPEDMSPPTSPQFSHELHGMAPLTLQERRLRNKAASAKYRQKKNQQQNDMRQMICRLSEHNAVLERQLQELRMENERLRASADRLRGKMVAKKILRQWIGRHQQHRKEPSSATSSSAFQTVPKNHQYHPYATTEEDGLELDFDEDDDVCLED